MLNVAIVEDVTDLRESLVDLLAGEGHHVAAFDSAESFVGNCSIATVDILVLDLGLPGQDGLSLARNLRAAWPMLGIIILTARGTPDERKAGYENGADIYLAKPSSAQELSAAIWALARRLGQKETDLNLFVLTSKAMTLRGPSGTVQLTAGEANLLEAFANAPENRLGIKEAEGQDHPTETTSKGSFVVQVGRLRKKLVAAGAIGEPINAIRGFGYQLSIPVTKS